MNGLEQLLTPYSGLFFSFAIFIFERITQASRDSKAKREKVDENTIRDYIEWCRKQDHAELIKKINDQQEALHEALSKIDGIQSLPHEIASLGESINDIHDLLARLNSSIIKRVLSSIPLDCRNVLGNEMLFRDQDIETLHSYKSDIIISGQPGSGKTFLAYHYAKARNGLFVISDSSDDVVTDLLIKKPQLVIVDDAADKLILLQRLQHLRAERGITFQLVAICWSFEEMSLASSMGLCKADIHRVNLISADDIATLITNKFQEAGYHMSNDVIREIRQQAAGRPGLAIKLVDLVVANKDFSPLLDAGVHYEILERVFRELERNDASWILAAFAVGGSAGMKKEDVANVLNIPVREVTNVLKTLATGGIIEEKSTFSLATRPAAFRHALLKREFLSGDSFSHLDKYMELFEITPNKGKALLCLIGAVSKGAAIDNDWLFNQIGNANTIELWEKLASVNKCWCLKVINAYSGPIEYIAKSGLEYVPEVVIPLLLDKMVNDKRAVNSHPECAERIISEWIVNFSIYKRDGVYRRKTLLAATEKWLCSGGEPSTGWKSLALCVSLKHETHETDPGAGRSFTWSTGLLLFDEIKELVPIWNNLLELANQYPPENWTSLADALNHWLYPNIKLINDDHPLLVLTRNTITTFIQELLEIPSVPKNAICRWGIENKIIDSSLIDKEFVIYCPPSIASHTSNWRKLEQSQIVNAEKLGYKWAKLTPIQVANKLLSMERECKLWGINDHAVYDGKICEVIAKESKNQVEWIELLVANDLRPETVAPFVDKMLQISPDWGVVSILLSNIHYRKMVAKLIVKQSNVPHNIINMCMSFDWIRHIFETAIHQNRISPLWIEHVASVATGKLALSFALNLFRSTNDLLSIIGNDKWLALFYRGIKGLETLNAHDFWDIDRLITFMPDIGMPILLEIINNTNYISASNTEIYKVLLGSISTDQKREILSMLAVVNASEFTSILIGDDINMYNELLNNMELKPHHLLPLWGDPANSSWQSKAIIAFNAGYSSEEIMRAAIGQIWSCTTEFYNKLQNSFSTLLSTDDKHLIEIGKIGVEYCFNCQSIIERNEYQEQLHGLDCED